MAVYFQLYKPGNDEPERLFTVDADMCAAFDSDCDPVRWYENWYDTIGFAIAMGRTKEQILEFFPDKANITNWIFANYQFNNWRG